MSGERTVDGNRWAQVWPDALAFAAGLIVARLSGWNTTDLVWSLWLSSLVVGYAMIVWGILGPGAVMARGVWQNRGLVAEEPLKSGAGVAVLLVGSLFMLAFFTVHFGMFHFVHSVFLNMFFPVADVRGTPGIATYLEVFRRYWFFLPVAFLAERAAFRLSPEPTVADASVTVEAIARRKAQGVSTTMMGPYRNVLRMHMLIFFFAFAHFMRLENFAVYAVVYAVYFFPWRLFKQTKDVT